MIAVAAVRGHNSTELATPYVFPVQSAEKDLDSPLSVKDTLTTVAN